MQRVRPLPLFARVAGNAEKPVPPPIPRGLPVGSRFAPGRTDELLATIPILGMVEPEKVDHVIEVALGSGIGICERQLDPGVGGGGLKCRWAVGRLGDEVEIVVVDCEGAVRHP